MARPKANRNTNIKRLPDIIPAPVSAYLDSDYPFFRPVLSCLFFAFSLSACTQTETHSLQGYAEGEYVRIASPFAGALESLAVKRGDEVTAGALLFTLEHQNEVAGRDEAAQRLRQAEAALENLKKGKRPSELETARAQLAQAKSALRLSELQLKRFEKLIGSGAVTQDKLDEARTSHNRDKARVAELTAQLETAQLPARPDEINAAVAQVETARAVLAQAQWRLAQKIVYATVDGKVDDTFYTPGEWVPAGNPVVSMLPPQNIKVRFFIPETQLGSLHIGQTVTLSCDGCPAGFPAHIRFIASQAEYTPPVIYSKESRSKLVYLVEAWPSPADAIKLRPGQPVDVQLKPA
ncbi:MAG TPA: HlyD family efflux transporter periplasmic adaptor subunit [Gammaproteobacteria bacterium]|nr:HlyD family efflux transporter periplasmic adaptor subunit [Gammaproteobacteria bacterium]